MDLFAGPCSASEQDFESKLLRAVITELSADDTYSDLISSVPKTLPSFRAKIEEILKDEQEHFGKLIAMLTELRGGSKGQYALNVQSGVDGK